ncbi:peptidyl-prolyl cis-trans isomerase FKBP62-like isoform X3 [Cornus florida]|uniref:peptidyl-prolyl cis-trans isomerase FKBP62-like isoform X3 n=1 Tax=Cornus florida TaxID=4283 RepID=UPI0028A089E5|nr:peptidyl-prolyl cis-trans isomerase FKBP62-like isoform X3 [Cornus florida]
MFRTLGTRTSKTKNLGRSSNQHRLSRSVKREKSTPLLVSKRSSSRVALVGRPLNSATKSLVLTLSPRQTHLSLTLFVSCGRFMLHYVGTLLDGTKFDSTRDRDKPFLFKLGCGQLVAGLDHGIITMKRGETALFTLPPELGYGARGTDGVPPNSFVQFEAELLSWITVVDVCKDGGIIKKIMEKGEQPGQPGDLDEVLVKYQVMLVDGAVVARTPEEGVHFYVKDGHFCPALPKAIKTMRRGEKVNLTVQPQYAFGEWGRDFNNEFPSVPPSSVLSIDLELVSFNPVTDITGDSKVFKKILKEGEGALTANEGATVTIKFTAMLEDGTVFEREGFNGKGPLEFITDEEQVIAGLDQAVATMKKGERAILTIDPEYGFGSIEAKCDLALVPPCSTIVYEVEMLDFMKEKAPWEMSHQERIEAAQRMKEGGNILFKNGKYQRAGKKYDKAADYVDDDGSFGDADQKLVKALRVSCWLNGAACGLKVNDFQGVIKLCSKVLDIELYNAKALYRRAQAYMETADLHLAELDITKALEADPHNRYVEVKLIQKKLKLLQVESDKRDAKLYANMFAHMTKDSSVATKKVEKVEDNKRDEDVMAMETEKRLL